LTRGGAVDVGGLPLLRQRYSVPFRVCVIGEICGQAVRDVRVRLPGNGESGERARRLSSHLSWCGLAGRV
jgi:hypothetical protein